MKIVSISKNLAKLKGRKVILRLDLNVPLVKGKVINDYKLRCALPTINLLRRLNCSIIIITHLGEPKLPLTKSIANNYSVQPLANWLARKLNVSLKVLANNWPAINSSVKKMKQGDIVMLENIRFFKGELENSKILAQQLAALGEIYVNDAFAVCHRAHTSVSAIKNYLPALAGPLLESELANLIKAKHGKKPLVLIMGGAKLSTKLPLLKKLAPQASVILVGGGIANTILKAHGFEVGKSLFDKEALRAYSRLKLAKVICPIDVAVFNKGKRLEKNLQNIKQTDKILDLGTKTVKLYAKYIKSARTIIWNGPVGLFEEPAFARGNKQLALLVARATKNKAFTLIGGGETVAALGNSKNFSWISTGGGATLAFLEGKNLPGLKKIVSY